MLKEWQTVIFTLYNIEVHKIPFKAYGFESTGMSLEIMYVGIV